MQYCCVMLPLKCSKQCPLSVLTSKLIALYYVKLWRAYVGHIEAVAVFKCIFTYLHLYIKASNESKLFCSGCVSHEFRGCFGDVCSLRFIVGSIPISFRPNYKYGSGSYRITCLRSSCGWRLLSMSLCVEIVLGT
jgi:hypothetical protein